MTRDRSLEAVLRPRRRFCLSWPAVLVLTGLSGGSVIMDVGQSFVLTAWVVLVVFGMLTA